MTKTTLTAAALAALLAAAPAFAQTEGTPAPETAPVPEAGAEGQEMAANFDDATLQAFVAAALDVRDIRMDYEGRIAEAADETAAEELATEAREEMLQAVENTDNITVEEYMAVGTAAQTDQELAQRLTMLFQEQDGGDVSGG